MNAALSAATTTRGRRHDDVPTCRARRAGDAARADARGGDREGGGVTTDTDDAPRAVAAVCEWPDCRTITLSTFCRRHRRGNGRSEDIRARGDAGVRAADRGTE